MPTRRQYKYLDDPEADTFELLESIADDPITEHEGRPVEQVFSPDAAVCGRGSCVVKGSSPFASRQVRPYDPDFSHCDYDGKGRPVINSPDDVNRAGAKMEERTGGGGAHVWDKDVD